MRLNVQRVFVGNLPTEVTENDISKRFSKYGKIQSTEIKRRSDGSVFAYVNLEADRSHINECLEHMSKRKWQGQHLKVELAKESFLDRLARERQEQQAVVKPNRVSAVVNPTGNFVHNGSQDDEFVQTCNFKNEDHKSAKLSNVKKFEAEDSETETCEVSYNKKLPMFKGTQSFVESNPKVEETVVEPSSPQKDVSKLTQKSRKKDSLECNLYHTCENNLKYQESIFKNSNYDHKKQKVQDHQIPSKVMINKRNVPAIKSLKSEEKRLKSIEEKRMSFKNQIQTVKRALAAVDVPPNKKIIFSDSEMPDVHTDDENDGDNDDKPTDKTSMLFNDDSSDDETNDFKIKAQFEGRKGQKLLELQTKYANDKRFTLDERFYESDDEVDAPVDSDKTVEFEDEKKRQLNILQDVLGDKGHVLPEKREKLSNSRSMLRFDPLKADHKRFEVPTVTPPEEMENESKKIIVENGLKIQDENLEVEDEKPVKVEVSKEKFYKVTDRLKETLKSKTQNDTQFSLLEMFGSTEEDKGAQSLQEKYENSELSKKKQIGWSRNPFKYDSSDSEDEYEVKKSAEPSQNSYETISESTNVASSFFFKENDARLKEGLEFITTAKRIGEEEFSKRRRELKLIIRAKIKNNLKKKRPWKKKLGGQKKKHVGKKRKH